MRPGGSHPGPSAEISEIYGVFPVSPRGSEWRVRSDPPSGDGLTGRIPWSKPLEGARKGGHLRPGGEPPQTRPVAQATEIKKQNTVAYRLQFEADGETS